MTTAADLLAHVGAGESKTAYAQTCIDAADALVVAYVGNAAVPTTVLDRAVLNVAAELYYQKDAPGGIRTDFTDVQATTVPRLTRNPMRAAYPLLDPFLPGGFA